jgi:hypothetical protein
MIVSKPVSLISLPSSPARLTASQTLAGVRKGLSEGALEKGHAQLMRFAATPPSD